MITFSCPACDKNLHVRDEFAGKKARCPNCLHIFTIPETNAIVDAEAEKDFQQPEPPQPTHISAEPGSLQPPQADAQIQRRKPILFWVFWVSIIFIIGLVIMGISGIIWPPASGILFIWGIALIVWKIRTRKSWSSHPLFVAMNKWHVWPLFLCLFVIFITLNVLALIGVFREKSITITYLPALSAPIKEQNKIENSSQQYLWKQDRRVEVVQPLKPDSVQPLKPEPQQRTPKTLKEMIASGKLIILASNGEFLGRVITSEYDADSILNEYGLYGGKYSTTSIFNDYGLYGGKYSSTSAFNDLASEPPKLFYDGAFVAFLTTNKTKSPRVDPTVLIATLKGGGG